MKFIMDIPPVDLSPNARVGWQARARAIKLTRRAAYISARQAGVPEHPYRAARIKTVWYFSRRNRRDGDNLIGRCKSVFDGLVDAGVISDDDRITHLPPQIEIDAENPRLEIIVEEDHS